MAEERPRTQSFTQDELTRKGSQLKHVTTKEYSGEPTEEEMGAIKKVWDEKSSNPQVLAKHFEIDADILLDNFPSDVETFAKNLFLGLYTPDKDEAAKDKFRQRLQIDLNRTSSKLRKSITKPPAGPTDEELQACAKVFESHKGDLTAIAEQLGLAENLLNHDPPIDAEDFASKVLAGNYTPDDAETAKSKLREKLRGKLIQKRPSLKKTTTKEGEGLSQEDSEVVFIRKLYPGRNLKEIDSLAEKFGLSAKHMKANLAKDAEEFAKKVLSGEYSADNNEVAKENLRLKLKVAINERRPSLAKATTRRMSNVSDEELTNFGAFYTKKGGDLEAIASESGIPIATLRSMPPSNAADFVLKLMTGHYTVDMDEQSKATLRACMRQEMVRTAKLLKKASTKEWDGKAHEDDVKLIAVAYKRRNGDLSSLALEFSLSHAALTSKPPTNAEDFAKHVLLGSYTVE